MKTITLSYFLNNIPFFLDEAKKGKIFVYPTDTVYGIGAIVNTETIHKINTAKQRKSAKHYSLIAPDFVWIQKHFKNTENIETQRQQRQAQYPTR